MPAPQNFRTAFNGFHREDVVRYLEYINTKHTAQVNQLTGEVDQLRAKLEDRPSSGELVEQVAALTAERDALLEQVAQLTGRCEALEEQLTTPATETAAAPCCNVADELEAYRRAERTERLAKERASQLYRQINGVLADATAKVDTVASEVSAVADQVMQQVTQLQTAVVSSKQALQDAAAAMYSIRPETEE